VLMGRNLGVRERQGQEELRRAHGGKQSSHPAGHREQNAFDQRLRDDLLPGGANRETHGRLRPTRDRTREQQVRHIRAGDERHEPTHGQQHLQTAAVLFFHHTDAGAGGNNSDRLLGQHADHIGHPVGRVSGLVLHPLAQDAGEARRHALGRGARPQSPNHAQPRRDRLTQQRAAAVDQRLLLQRNPQVGWIASKCFAEKSRRRDPDHRERMALYHERRADNRRVAAVRTLPDVMAEHNDRRRRRLTGPENVAYRIDTTDPNVPKVVVTSGVDVMNPALSRLPCEPPVSIRPTACPIALKLAVRLSTPRCIVKPLHGVLSDAHVTLRLPTFGRPLESSRPRSRSNSFQGGWPRNRNRRVGSMSRRFSTHRGSRKRSWRIDEAR
jgi:hypothetical protein